MKKDYVLNPESITTVSGTLKDVGVGESMGNSGDKLAEKGEEPERKAGLSFGMASFFMVAQMAGAGFLSLPKAVANAGWGGVVMIVVFCISVGFAASRLGRCWNILEERWDEYKKPSRQPYQEIAYRAFGIHGRRLVLACLMITLTGSTIVFIILIAQMIGSYVPSLSQCEWVLIVSAVILPTVWLGSPKDFWQASVLAVLATVVAVVVIVAKIIYDREKYIAAHPVHSLPTISSFSLGFSAILFSYGGASVFPTIQNDMKNKADFTKSVIFSFSIILMLYLPVGIVGYVLIGDAVDSNILLTVGPSVIVLVAIGLQIVNLLGTFIISMNPVVQTLEDIIGIPTHFCWQRVAIRSSVIVLEVLVAFAIPDFALILNLIGASTIGCLTFVMPPLMYMRLVDDRSEKSWPERNVALWERIYLWVILIVGVVGGLAGTVSAVMAILQPSSFSQSCFVNFLGTKT